MCISADEKHPDFYELEYYLDNCNGKDLLLAPQPSSPLHFAVSGKYTTVTKYLLAKKLFNVNQQNSIGATPLHYACNNGKARTIKLLLKYKADPSIVDEGN